MLLKKCALIGSALAALALPVIASSANLETYNWTDQASTVKVVSNGKCSADFGKITPAFNHSSGKPGYLSTPSLGVMTVCGMFSGTCTADMYASANCTGTRVARLSINVANLNVNLDKSVPVDSHYSIGINGTRVDIKALS